MTTYLCLRKGLERKLKEEREEKAMEVAELRRQLDSVRMSGSGGATPNPQVRREEVVCNDIELLSSLSPFN